jgi:uncharacterized phage protein (TIGR01671 family)
MREIKFRAWDIKSKKFRTSVPVLERWWDSDCWDDSEEAMEEPFVNLVHPLGFSDRLIYDQFTGAHDKNGVEIYENDIVQEENEFRITPRNELIKWISTNDGWGADGWYGIPSRDYMTHKVQGVVVGNIHENPELI